MKKITRQLSAALSHGVLLAASVWRHQMTLWRLPRRRRLRSVTRAAARGMDLLGTAVPLVLLVLDWQPAGRSGWVDWPGSALLEHLLRSGLWIFISKGVLSLAVTVPIPWTPNLC